MQRTSSNSNGANERTAANNDDDDDDFDRDSASGEQDSWLDVSTNNCTKNNKLIRFLVPKQRPKIVASFGLDFGLTISAPFWFSPSPIGKALKGSKREHLQLVLGCL